MRYISIILVFILQISFCNAQQTDSLFEKEKFISLQAEDFYVDALGNMYVINSKQQLKKLNAKGDSVAVFNLSKRLGKLYNLDATYALKTMLFFKEFSTIVTVDRLLNITNTIDLRNQGIFQPNALAASYDNQFWFYDEQIAKLKKINNQGVITQQTADLRQVLDKVPSPMKIVENNNTVYVYDSAQGIFSFDYYGAYKSFTKFTGYDNVYIYNNHFYAIANNCLYKCKEKNGVTTEVKLPTIANVKKIVLEKTKLYFLTKDGIYIYNTK